MLKEAYRKEIGHARLIHNDKKDILMHRWRYPSLSLHGLLSQLIILRVIKYKCCVHDCYVTVKRNVVLQM